MQGAGTERKRNFIILRIAAIFIVTFLVYYAVMYSIGRSRKFEELSKLYAYTSGKEQPEKSIITDSAFIALLKEKAFLQAKTIMAETDSIYLLINLCDSISDIEISGVTVHSARIGAYDASSMIRKGDRSIIYNMLSRPFTIDSAFATIRKEPIMVKIAPRDTSEYRPDITPDTSKVESVNCLLSMNDGMRLIIMQEETDQKGDLRNKFMFDIRIRLSDTWQAIKRIARFRVPEYHPYIKIWMPRDDARIIYRALPFRGQVAVYT